MNLIKKWFAALRARIVDDWRQAWRWLSVQAMAAAVLFPTVLGTLPERYQNSIPDRWVLRITIALIIIGIAGRLFKQGGSPPAGQGGGQ
jgi:hypothetical protein